ncbi:NADH dehydrogenase [ubiquinone] 1 beta subcomplex subunit 3 [Varanus komodoensis]|uniref:NADH dehydrogenase [ubiquinone] 1 beta subcomplex subunit 3 n=1 Tax=Varanus komodoensis TaxID=61221 RepID=UPI001CF78033|nr:NADH dehydrogenase [ubiquinone] 1 beta subcomplex subunit 3 [Varanus komodoensis]
MGHGHEHSKVKLPDYRMWKIEGTPLQTVQEMLARRGLKDPWLRLKIWALLHRITYTIINEAWRYMGGYAKPITLLEVLGKGFKWGFAAFVVALAVEYTLFPPKKDEGHH